jgi:hypothetical protein
MNEAYPSNDQRDHAPYPANANVPAETTPREPCKTENKEGPQPYPAKAKCTRRNNPQITMKDETQKRALELEGPFGIIWKLRDALRNS